MVFPLRSFVVSLAIILLLSGCTAYVLADTAIPTIALHPPKEPLSISATAKTTTTPTTTTTIAPIQTIAPEIKPPVEQPSPTLVTGSPTVVQTETPIRTPSATPSVTTTGTSYPSGTDDESVDPETNYQWGLAYENLGQYTEAIAEYDKAIAKDPSFTNAWYRKGVTLEKIGKYDEAKEAFSLLLAIDPTYKSTEESSNLTYLRGNVSGNRTGLSGFSGKSLTDPNILLVILLLVVIIAGVAWYLNREKKRKDENIRNLSDISTGEQHTDAGSATVHHPGAVYDESVIETLFQVATEHHSGNPEVIRAVLTIAYQISVEGREGKHVGTAFIVGDSDAVLQRSRQLILNPVSGHPREELSIANPAMTEYFKELAQLDGAFVISDDGVVEAAGRYISIDTSNVRVQRGLGTRHVSVAAITSVTNALGIVVSESGGGIRIYVKGKDVSC